MISNITNALPVFLKRMKSNENAKQNELKFDIIESIKFYNSILPKSKEMVGFKHIFLDSVFILNENKKDLLKSFSMTLDTFHFLKDFYYDIDVKHGILTIRSNIEELAILSLILIGSIRNLAKDSDTKNKGIFISLAFHFLTFCKDSNYNVCTSDDLKVLENYNEGFDEEMFSSVMIGPTSENDIGTIHFVGIDLNKDILCIFEKYKNVKFTFNEENASFIISMESKNWDDFWKNAPRYLIEEFNSDTEKKIDIR